MHAVDLLSMVQNPRFFFLFVSENESNLLIELNTSQFLAQILHTSFTNTGNAMHQSKQEWRKT